MESAVLVALADIFRRHGPDSRANCGAQLPPLHLRAMQDIAQCRTERLGGQMSPCAPGPDSHYSYHSCTNRHGPKCQQEPAEQWLENQPRLLLPVIHVLGTCTLPEELSAVTRSHQQTLYTLLFQTSSEALQALAGDPRGIGGRVALVGVLPTWTRALRYHPHVHSIAAGGGLAATGHWQPSRPDCLVPVKPLAGLFRAKFRDGLHQTALFPRVDQPVGLKDWGGHGEPVGRGQEALRSLAPYIFRVALSHNRLLKLADGQGTCQYKEAATAQGTTCTVTAEECMRRFLQHVLPHRFGKVRDDGVLSPGHRHLLTAARQVLGGSAVATKRSGTGGAGQAPMAAPHCPRCGSPLRLGQTLRPTGRWPSCPCGAGCPCSPLDETPPLLCGVTG
jgi:Putative transposase/Transposase zinc-binding domain